MKRSEYDLFIFAGELSADLHGEELLRALYASNKHLKIFGVGGPKMRNAGLDCIMPMESFQVMGFSAVIKALAKIIKQFYALRKMILNQNPKAVLFIDYPGFNLRMEKHLRKKGYKGKIIHYICPSVWAWGKKRIPLMENTLDCLLTIFPFEKQYFQHLRVEYVGHPLVSRTHNHNYKQINLPSDKKVIGIFPGSRKKEIFLNFPVYLQVMRELEEKDPNLIFAISVASQKHQIILEKILSENKYTGNQSIVFIQRDLTYELMKNCYMAIAKSGTVTLELALHGVPTVVTYGISSFDLFIAKTVLKIILPYYCIVNIVGQKEVFPELIGPNLTKERLLKSTESFLYLENLYENCKRSCKKIKKLLGHKIASQEAAKIVSDLL